MPLGQNVRVGLITDWWFFQVRKLSTKLSTSVFLKLYQNGWLIILRSGNSIADAGPKLFGNINEKRCCLFFAHLSWIWYWESTLLRKWWCFFWLSKMTKAKYIIFSNNKLWRFCKSNLIVHASKIWLWTYESVNFFDNNI